MRGQQARSHDDAAFVEVLLPRPNAPNVPPNARSSPIKFACFHHFFTASPYYAVLRSARVRQTLNLPSPYDDHVNLTIVTKYATPNRIQNAHVHKYMYPSVN